MSSTTRQAGRSLSLRRVAAGLTVAGAATLGYATLVEPRRIVLRQAQLKVLRDPKAPPLRLLHISDLHLWPAHDHLAAALRRFAAAEPQVVVATGDLLGHPDVIGQAVELLAELGRGRPAIAVLGSNDRYGPQPKNPFAYLRRLDGPVRPHGEPLDTTRLVAGLTAAGWHVIDNRAVRLETAAGVLDVRGVGDAHIGADDLAAVPWHPPAPDALVALGVTHAPYRRVLDAFDRAGLDLALAGHTHGGQVRIPGIGALTANCDLPLHATRGVSWHGAGLPLHVSAGLGQSRYAPLRFACRPEATLLELIPHRPY